MVLKTDDRWSGILAADLMLMFFFDIRNVFYRFRALLSRVRHVGEWIPLYSIYFIRCYLYFCSQLGCVSE